MPFRQVGVFLLAVCAFLLTCAPGLAQPEVAPSEPTPKATAPASTRPAIRQVGFDIYAVDKNGELVLVPNIPLEKLLDFWKIAEELANPGPPLPDYAMHNLSVTGTASGKQAKLTATIEIRLLRDGWVRVPLGFSNAFLLEATHERDVDLFFADEKDVGYVCYIQASKEKLHRISLQLIAPVREVGSEYRLAFQAPSAASSGLNLLVPLKEVTATASNELPVGVKEQGEETLLVVTGLGDAFQMSWREGVIQPTDVKPLLEVRSETLVEVIGERNVNSDVRLVVNSLRGKFDTFDVRLPAGARLSDRQPSQSGLQVSKAAGEEESGVTLVQVKPDQPTSGPVEVQLWLELAPTTSETKPEFEIGGLDVEDAVRQSGWIDIDVSNKDLTVDAWEAGPDVVQTLVPESRRQKVYARFEFVRSPSSLRMRVSATPRKTEISIEPIYVLHVEPTRVVLDATLKYRVRGAAPSAVSINMPGWQVSEVSPDTLVNDEAFDRDRPGPLVVPLLPPATPESDRFTLQIRATQEIADPSAIASFTLPRPDAKILTPATVVVRPADNVELTVEEDDSVGLERESFPPKIDDLPPRQQASLYYRERSDARSGTKPTVFAASLRVRQRAVSVRNICELEVDPRSVRVEQQIEYRIVYEPLGRVPLVVPRSVLATGGLKILCDEEPLPFDEVEVEEDGAPTDAGPARIQVDLQEDRIGRCDIVVEHEHSVSDLSAGSDGSLRVPLVIPGTSEGTTVTGSTLRIRQGEDAQVEVADGDWVAVEEGTESLDGERELKSSAAPSFASLRINRSKPRRQMSTTISHAWIQTWLDSTRRHERAVFRVTTNRSRIEVRLPNQDTIEDLVVALDGRSVLVPAGDARSIPIAIPGEPTTDEHVVELWYHTARQRGLVGRVGIEPPVIVDAKGANRWYWQLATPPREHLLNLPAGMASEMTWRRRGFFLGRCPRLGQTELERWTGATAQTPIPETLNHYLFSSFGEVSERRCATADRTAILLTVSGFALVLGLALIYVPRLRHPGLLFAGGVAVVSAVLLYPSLSIGIAQASCLGLVLIVAAGLLKWFVDLPLTQGVLVRGAPYSSPDSKTVKGPVSPIDSHAARQTSTIPASTPVSAAESST